MTDHRIMVVDDEEDILDSIRDYFVHYNIITFSRSPKAVSHLRNNYYDIIVSDYRMPDINGLDLLVEAKKYNAYYYGILLTAYAEKDLLEEFLNRELIRKVIEKPLNLKDLKTRIDEALTDCRKKKEKESEIDNLKALYEETKKQEAGVIGIDGGLKGIFSNLRQIVPTNESIFITGETGTGKELIARNIHCMSKRKDGPFVKINCGALPDTLIESELFGYARGAFSNAYADKKGKIELSHRGTLFLDEIAELKPELQVKLLHVIQEKKVERLGSNKAMDVDFRLISATNRDISSILERNIFRQDLFFRINTFHIHLPPLRERQEDFEPLVEHLLSVFCQELGKRDITLTQNAIQRLRQYYWPGNIRELESVLKRAIILLDPNNNQINESFFDYLWPVIKNDSAIESLIHDIIGRKLSLKSLETTILKALLKHFRGNVMQAVKETGISKDRFYRINKS